MEDYSPMESLRRWRPASLVLALGLALLVRPAAAQAPARSAPTPGKAPVGRGLIWQVEREGRTGWLVGSLHLLTADAYPLPGALDAAFAKAEVLVEEADPGELTSPEGVGQLMARALYPQGVTLESQVSKETFAKMAERAGRLGLPVEGIQRLKPWMVALTLVRLELQRGGFDPSLGLDRHFLERAPGAGKSVRTLETALEQIDMLEQLSPQLQESLVSATFDGADTELAQIRRIAAAWKAGDAEAVERILLDGTTDAPAVYELLVTGRNRRWVPQIEACLGSARCFVVVGAAHLVGPDGLVALLRARGYTVAQQ